MRLAENVAGMGDGRVIYRVLVGIPEGRRPLGRPRRRWEDDFKMDFPKGGCGDMDWIELAQDTGQVAGTCECGNVLLGSIKGGGIS